MPHIIAKFFPSGQRLTGRMGTPKKMADIMAWYKDSRKVVPAIPLDGQGDWRMHSATATLEKVEFELRTSIPQEKVMNLIDRTSL